MTAKIIGIIGSLALGISTLLPWGKLVFKKFGGETTKQVGGIELIQGYIVIGLAVVALILFFARPKLAIIPGILAILMGLWYYILDVVGTPFQPALGVWIEISAGVVVSVAALVAPNKPASR